MRPGTCRTDSLPETVRSFLDKEEFLVNETVLTSCPGHSGDELFSATCTEMEDNRADWNLSCLRRCKAPSNWDPKLQFAPDKTSYALNEVVQLSCAGSYQPSVPVLSCISNRSQTLWNVTAVCEGTCQRPQWDQSLQLTPDQRNYKENDEVMLSCPEGLHPSFTEVKCKSEVKSTSHGKPVYREVWMGRNGTAGWIHIRSDIECAELLQIFPETVEVSATSIKLNWTCRFPHACQDMRGICHLAWSPSPRCKVEEVMAGEMLQGWKGTFTCPLLQPFTLYSVTIYLPPSTVLFTWQFQTKQTACRCCSRTDDLSDAKTCMGGRLQAVSWARSCLHPVPGYVAAVLNLTAPTDFVLGDGTLRHGYYNAPLQPDGNYAVLLRLVRRGQQAEKFTCVCYNVSAGQEPISQLVRTVVVIAVALVVALLALGILLLFLLVRRKRNSSKACERNSTIPLKKCRGGAV
ncbi:PREDICTED: uncharacterized protein LOC104574456 [Tinamus guttatus]|uniref:uncharacterized protein LOC104574456 n=1 Tax=Tinamus guttatus TaxID=94827 RepID=UPI00052F03CE|nr:PREDICTED: uncharacterized protein LOC104574456 [Tinamus guttatus]